MAKETILIIEDEKNIQELLKYNLEEAGYHTLKAVKGNEGLQLAQKQKPDLVLLDLMLPELSGIEVCKILKNNSATSPIPIIMLTAKGTETDKIIGLELGADDYITKPFSPRELLARIKAVLRRLKEKPKFKILRAGLIEVDLDKHIVLIKKKPIGLTSKEFSLLKELMSADGRVLTREQLLEKVWGYDESIHIETRTVDMHILQLRKKLKSEADKIITVKNVGYRFQMDDK